MPALIRFSIFAMVAYSVAATGQEAAPVRLRGVPELPIPKGARYGVNKFDGLTYILVPAGKFHMGCSSRAGEDCSPLDESREVTIERSFWIGQTEVTQGAYFRVMGTNPMSHGGALLPVDSVTVYNAEEYCEKVGMRLPDDDEWEYAARAGTTGPRYGAVEDVAWYAKNADYHTHEVGQKQPNAWGLYDIFGNVGEWTAGVYARNKYDIMYKVYGGSWATAAEDIKFWSYTGVLHSVSNRYIGFRCVGISNQ